MRKVIITIMSICLSALIIVVTINLIYNTSYVGDRKGMLETAGALAGTEKEVNQYNVEISNQNIETIEDIKYEGRTFFVGESVWINTLFDVKYVKKSEYVPVANSDDIMMNVKDITSEDGTSLTSVKITTADDFSDEIIVPLSFSSDTQTVTFYQSGVYTTYVDFYDASGQKISKEITMVVSDSY